MTLHKIIATAIIGLLTMANASPCETRPTAVVYRGPAASPYLPESAAAILQQSPLKFHIVYAGPNEDVDVDDETLKHASLYVQPGGGDLGPAWKHMKPYDSTIKKYVSSGGRYVGFCLGAYLAGHNQGFGLLPGGQEGGGAEEEINQDNNQANGSAKDMVVQVDWHFTTGSKAGKTEKGRWLYFQDGADFNLPAWKNVTVLGRYSTSQDVAAAITPYGKGWVGVVGPHPEADKTWYDLGFKNPDGVKTDIAIDFVMATMQQGAKQHIANRTGIFGQSIEHQ